MASPPNTDRKPPILIYQMGQVGSSALYEWLSQRWAGDVYQVHRLGVAQIEKAMQTGKPPNHIIQSSKVRAMMDSGESIQWKIITLMREPIARDISAFFENISTGYVPQFVERLNSGQITVEECINIFLTRFDFQYPLRWFDLELKTTFAVDVCNYPFSASKGYSVISAPTADVLVLRYEDLKRATPPALRDFLGLECIELPRVRVTSSKSMSLSALYARFKESIVIPDAILDKVYSAPIVRHFYNGEEITAFRERWSARPREQPVPNATILAHMDRIVTLIDQRRFYEAIGYYRAHRPTLGASESLREVDRIMDSLAARMAM